MSALVLASNTAPFFPSIPAMGNLEQYISTVKAIPNLTPEEELELSVNKESGDVEAAKALVLSHLKVVVAVARQFFGYGLPKEDLIQEGNIGLMVAVKKFDTSYGFKLVSFAIPHIKNAILAYVVRNIGVVRKVTTKAAKKLFFNFKKYVTSASNTVTAQEADRISKELNVPVSEVMKAHELFADDKPLVATYDDGDEVTLEFSDERWEPVAVLENKAEEKKYTDIIEALNSLDDREKTIIQKRWIDDNKPTLHELGAELGVTYERVRQLEQKALAKVKAYVGAN